MTTRALDPRVSASVPASAGSGKTWQLTSRVLRLLLNGAKPSGIVALTFTRKAAAEMRVRIHERLHEWATRDDASLDAELRAIGETPTPVLRERARRLHRQQLFEPFPLRTSTLHAFCQDLLNRFALEAGLTPGLALIEQERGLCAQAWRRTQARLLRQPESAPARALAVLVSLGAGEHEVIELVMEFLQRRNDWRAFVQGHEDDVVAFAIQTLREQMAADANGDAPESDDAFNAKLCILLRYLETMGGTRWVKPDRLAESLERHGDEQRLALEAALLTGEGRPYKIADNEACLKKLKGEERPHFLRTYEDVQQELGKRRRAAARARTLARSEAACTLGAAALSALESQLIRENALGFAELEWHCLRLLTRAEAADWIRCKLDRRIDHLLVDEFQDTSAMQWQLLRPLLDEMNAGDSGRARSAFIVGDAKQSIFGFRRANPEVFSEAQAWIAQLPESVREPLRESRRSAPAVIDFVNALFGGREVGGALFEPHTTTRLDDWGRIEVAPPVERGEAAQTTEGLRDPLTTPRPQLDDERAQQEAQQVVARIRALLGSGVAVSDKAGGTHRIGAGDILVLARWRTHLPALEDALAQAGIPFIGAARGTLLETSEAQDLLALLRWLDAPHRDLDLAQVLRSPLFSMSDESLLQLADAAGDGDWWTALEPHRSEWRRPRELLWRWRALAARAPVHDLLDAILKDSDAARRYRAALPAGARERVTANLGALLQLALETDQGRYPSLGSFLDQLEDLAGEEAPDEAAPETDGERVRVLTVHAAKGLEAAAVFLVNAGFKDRTDTPRWLTPWPARASRPTHFIASAGRRDELDPLSDALVQAQQADEARENLNLLYVSVTRARQFLHISGMAPARGSDTTSWHAQALGAIARLGSTHTHATGQASFAVARSTAQTARSDPRLQQSLRGLPQVAAPPSGAVRAVADADAAARGCAIHRALELLSRNREAAVDEGRDEALAVLNAPALARFFGAGRAWNEVPLFDAEGHGGIADRVVDDGTTIWVLDYKTAPAPDAALLRERHRHQIAEYLRIANSVWPGRVIRGGLILTATGEYLELS